MTSLTFNRIPKCHFRGISLPEGEPQHCPHCIANKLNYCGAVDQDLGTQLQAIVTRIRFERGQTLFTQEDSADYIFVLFSGVVSCSHYMADGRRQIMAFLFPGDYAGMATGEHYRNSGEAVTDGEICRFPRGPFHKLLMNFCDFEKHFFQEVSNELAEAEKHVLILGRKDALERVATFLLMLDERENRYGDGHDIELPMVRADIADYLGLTVETVSRALTKLRKSGVIAVPDAHAVRIMDSDGLQELAAEGIPSHL